MYVTLKQLAKRLNRSERTIYLWMEKGIISSVNTDISYAGPPVFNEKDVKQLEEQMMGQLTIYAAAKFLKVPYHFLQSWITEQGTELNVKQEGKRPTYYLKRSWLEQNKYRILEDYQFQRGLSFPTENLGERMELYNSEINLHLFEKIIYHGQEGIVWSLDPFQIKIDNRVIEIQGESVHAVPRQFEEMCGKVVRHKGEIILKVPMSLQAQHPTYSLLGQWITLDLKNIEVYRDEQTFQIVLHNGIYEKWGAYFSDIQPFLYEGDIFVEEDNLIVGNIEKRISVPVSYRTLQKIEKEAKEQGISTSRWISNYLEE